MVARVGAGGFVAMAGKRALVLATNFFGVGGVERYTRTLARALGDILGADSVDVYALFGKRSADDTNLPYRYLGSAGETLTRAAKVRFGLRCLQLAARKKYALVFCSHVAVAPFAYLIRRLGGSRYLLSAYGIEVWNEMTMLQAWGLHHADLILPISAFTAGKVAERHGIPRNRMQLLYSAVDDRLLSEGAIPRDHSADSFNILTVARLVKTDQSKGCEGVLRALALLDAPGREKVTYTIVGVGDDRPRLEALASALGLRERVVFVGRVDEATLIALYRSSDLYAMPSAVENRNGRLLAEGFGITCIEAAAFGLPVITSREGGTREAVVDGVTGFVVDPRNVQELAEKIGCLQRDNALLTGMGEAGRRQVLEKFAYFCFVSALRPILLSSAFERAG